MDPGRPHEHQPPPRPRVHAFAGLPYDQQPYAGQRDATHGAGGACPRHGVYDGLRCPGCTADKSP